MEVGKREGECYTVTTRMIPALRWAATRAILMFQLEVMDSVHKPASTSHNSERLLNNGLTKSWFFEPYNIVKIRAK